MWLRFVAGRPVSAVTGALLAWCSAQLAAQGFTALLLIWGNASWHRSHAVRHWVRQHNQRVKRGAVGVRFVVCQLPSKSPWLNPIEPKWVHGKRAVSEPDRLLSADELETRVYTYYGCEREAHLIIPKSLVYYELVLQLCFWACTPPVVIILCYPLVPAAPCGPVQYLTNGLLGGQHQPPKEAANLSGTLNGTHRSGPL